MSKQHVDVLIIGAGVSGIGMACHLKRECPGKSFAILERRQSLGGTWDLFRYPGIRSDSDMFTLGYNFRPWEGEKAVADGDSIWQYIRNTAAENNILEHIRYNHWITDAEWSSADTCWTITADTLSSRARTVDRRNRLSRAGCTRRPFRATLSSVRTVDVDRTVPTFPGANRVSVRRVDHRILFGAARSPGSETSVFPSRRWRAERRRLPM